MRILDPTCESGPPKAEPAPRLATLENKTIGFISNGKEGTDRYFNYLADALRTQYGVKDVVIKIKSNYSAPAEPDIVNGITEWDAMMSGVGD